MNSKGIDRHDRHVHKVYFDRHCPKKVWAYLDLPKWNVGEVFKQRRTKPNKTFGRHVEFYVSICLFTHVYKEEATACFI